MWTKALKFCTLFVLFIAIMLILDAAGVPFASNTWHNIYSLILLFGDVFVYIFVFIMDLFKEAGINLYN